jgi:transcriptional regulator with XRE-family HTH domain
MNTVGHPELAFNPEGLSQQQIAEKISKGRAAAGEAAAGQKSFASLQAYLSATANPSLSRQAALALLADSHMENQMEVDRMHYHSEFDKNNQSASFGIPRSYLASDVDQAFHQDMKAVDYERERNSYAKLIGSPIIGSIMYQLQNGSERQKAELVAALDKKYGNNFHRWFTGG